MFSEREDGKLAITMECKSKFNASWGRTVWPDKPLGWHSICNTVQMRKKKGNNISGRNPAGIFQLASSRPARPPLNWWKMTYQFIDAANHSCVKYNMTQTENFQLFMSSNRVTFSVCTLSNVMKRNWTSATTSAPSSGTMCSCSSPLDGTAGEWRATCFSTPAAGELCSAAESSCSFSTHSLMNWLPSASLGQQHNVGMN